ncbi:VOC family protein [Plantactinospora sp. WMMB782]|uniref:VOC family protein n=1 Tax=Plantactinospora sp. WMMB782 TaxID=3404121 RepID=UPI003B92B8FF
MTVNSTPPPQVWPTLRARDARRLIRFLVDTFGFEEVMVIADGDSVHYAQLRWPPGGGIMLGSVRDDQDDPWPVQPGGFGGYAVTDELDELYARVVAAGAEVVQELRKTDFGSQEFHVRDPEGNRWSFGTYRGEPVPS